MQAEYQKRVEFLLAAASFPGLPPDQLVTFKLRHATCAFICRFPGCKSLAKGYPTPDARAQHEKTHAPPLVCPHSGCTYKLGFGSAQSLNRHVKRDHVPSHGAVPRQMRPRTGIIRSLRGVNDNSPGLNSIHTTSEYDKNTMPQGSFQNHTLGKPRKGMTRISNTKPVQRPGSPVADSYDIISSKSFVVSYSLEIDHASVFSSHIVVKKILT